ncbi:MAG: hypothetical protein K1X91_04945 [Bacteriodetes bacterium]|nr:hypothetical protein [Bacteroidota bacterium]
MKYFWFTVVYVLAISIQTTTMQAQATFASTIDETRFDDSVKVLGIGGVDTDVKRKGWISNTYSLANNNHFQLINNASASIPAFDSLSATGGYVEILGINTKSPFRFSVGAQGAIKNDSLPNEFTAKLLALKKMLNGGGNIVLNISLYPATYFNKDRSLIPMFYWGINLSGFTDVKVLNSKESRPARGLQGSIETDLRLLSVEAQDFNGKKTNVSIGIRGKALWNVANNQFIDKYSTNYNFDNIKMATLSVLIKYYKIDLQYTHTWAPDTIIPIGSGDMFTISVSPDNF